MKGGRKVGKGWEGKGIDVRNEHEHLFICIADKFWLWVHTLCPCLLDNLGA